MRGVQTHERRVFAGADKAGKNEKVCSSGKSLLFFGQSATQKAVRVRSIVFVTMPFVTPMAVLSKEIGGLVLENQWLDASNIFSSLAFDAFI